MKIGDLVRTHSKQYLLKGKTFREGKIAGFCKDPDYIRVCWDGWKEASSQAVDKKCLEIVGVGDR